jgi:iron complex outermembrane receptor protein
MSIGHHHKRSSSTPWRLLSLSVAISAALASPVWAQDAENEDEEKEATRLENLSVTARRVEETVQDVPVSVSAFSDDDLRNLQAENLDSLQGAVPNLNIAQGRGSASSVNVFIRGIGQPDALQTFDPGVGIYVDDVYISRIQGSLFNLFDIERLEVLRGPQGTLYGKNSTGGAIKIVTKQPSDVTEGAAEVTFGNYGRAEGKFYLSGPLGGGWSASVSGLVTRLEGFVEDPLTGRDFNDDDSNAFRLKLRNQVSDNFSLTLSADYTHQQNEVSLGRPEATLISVDLADNSIVPLLPAPAEGSEFNYFARTSFGPDQDQELDHWGVSLLADWDINDQWSMKSITAYRELDTDFFIDIDASEFELGDVFVGLDQEQFSQELQFHYDNGSNFRSVIGLYYLTEDVPSVQRAFADDLLRLGDIPIDFLRTIDDDLETDSYAAFVNTNWNFAPNWTLSAGIRYSYDEKTYRRSTSTFSNTLPPLEGTFAFEDDDDWDAITPSFALEYQLNNDALLYASANRGYKSGGFNGRANSASDVGAFDPEFVWTYEVGAKLTWLDGRLVTNWSAFHSDYKDFQARVAEDISSFPVINAASLDINGIELEASALLDTGTIISAQVGYLDAEYDEFFDFRFPGQDRSDQVVPFSPDWTLRLAAVHTFYLPNGGGLTIGADANWRDDIFLSVDNRDSLSQDAYWVFNAFTRYETPDRHWQFSAGVRNLDNEVYKTDAQEFSSVGNIQTAYYGDPRTYYVSARYTF